MDDLARPRPSLRQPAESHGRRVHHRAVRGLRLAVPLVAAVLAGPFVASASAANPTITFTSPPSPARGSTVTTNSASFTFVLNRTPKQTRSMTCALSGPTSFGPAACKAATAVAAGSQSANNTYSFLANGAYTFTVVATLTDNQKVSAALPFTVNAPVGCLVTNTRTNSGYASLQAANDAAQNGDTLTVQKTCKGTTTISHNLTINGVDGTSPTLDGNLAGTTLSFQKDLTYTVSNLTIQNGHATNGGGVYVHDGSTFAFNHLTVSDNTADRLGGGFYIDDDSSGSMNFDVVTNDKGGIVGGVAVVDANVTIANSTITVDSVPPPDTCTVCTYTTPALAFYSSSGSNIATIANTTVDSVYSVNVTVSTDLTSSVGGFTFITGVGCARNQEDGLAYPTMQSAHDNAVPGDHLEVTGTCTGGTVFTRDVHVVGPTTPGAVGVLDGGGTARPVYVARISPTQVADVSISGVTITNGAGSLFGGGIRNDGILSLDGVKVTGNHAGGGPTSGGGIFNHGLLTAVASSITGNTADLGGGIYNEGRLVTVTSDISGNSAQEGGGLYDRSNTDQFGSAPGLVTTHATTIHNNTASDHGGGAYLSADQPGHATLVLDDASQITGNTATNDGGGVFNLNLATLTLLNGSSITGNSPNDVVP
jgi:hypothetical protein